MNVEMRSGGITNVLTPARLFLPLLLSVIFICQMMWSSLGHISDDIALASSAETFWQHPWTIVSYGFVHASVAHFLTTLALMVYLLFFFENFRMSDVFGLFVLGTFVGGCLFLIFSPGLVPVGSTLVGASAGVCALVPTALVSMRHRGYRVGELLMRVLPLIGILVLDMVTLYHQSNWGILSHIGGYVGGAIWVCGAYLLKRRHRRNEITRSEEMIARTVEKVNRSGYASLSEEERALLDTNTMQGR